MTARTRLRVDPIACDGRGLCAEVVPELVTLDDWGFPIIRESGVPDGLREEAEEAVRLCPKLALRLEQRSNPAAGRDGPGIPVAGRAARHLGAGPSVTFRKD